MNANPRCSVIIPTYNCLDLLPHALASVRMQAVEDVEILIIDDASTDGTGEWLAAEAARDPASCRCTPSARGRATREISRCFKPVRRSSPSSTPTITGGPTS